jgi:hypothetical protein
MGRDGSKGNAGRKLLGVVLGVVLGLGLAPGLASAGIVTFDGMGPVGEVASARMGSEAGFDILINPVFFVGLESGTDLEMEPRVPSCSGSMEITQTGGGLFEFTGLDIQNEYGVGSFVTLQGLLGSALVATDTFYTARASYVTVFALNPSGVAIDTLVMTGQRDFDGGIAGNDLQVDPIPEPATLVLLGNGLLGLGARRRRRPRSSPRRSPCPAEVEPPPGSVVRARTIPRFSYRRPRRLPRPLGPVPSQRPDPAPWPRPLPSRGPTPWLPVPSPGPWPWRPRAALRPWPCPVQLSHTPSASASTKRGPDPRPLRVRT